MCRYVVSLNKTSVLLHFSGSGNPGCQRSVEELVSNVASKSHQCFTTTAHLLTDSVIQRIFKVLKLITRSIVHVLA